MSSLPARLRPLQYLQNESLHNLLKKQNRYGGKGLNRHELDELWSIVSDSFGKQLDSLMSAASADLPRDCETEEKLVEGENFIMSVLYLVPKTLCGKDDIHIPDSLMDVLLALQGFLCNPAIPDRVQCATAQLFLDLYKRRYLQPAECVNVLQYYLDCVLNEKSSVTWVSVRNI